MTADPVIHRSVSASATRCGLPTGREIHLGVLTVDPAKVTCPACKPPKDVDLRRQLGQVLGATGQAPAPGDPGDDGTEPYCAVCGEWAGLFRGLAGWHHYRGDPAPGGERIVYDAGHAAVIGWCRPPGLALSPRGLIVLGRALGDAVAYWEREAHAKCDDCENSAAGLCDDHAAASGRTGAYVVLGRQLGIEVSGQ